MRVKFGVRMNQTLSRVDICWTSYLHLRSSRFQIRFSASASPFRFCTSTKKGAVPDASPCSCSLHVLFTSCCPLKRCDFVSAPRSGRLERANIDASAPGLTVQSVESRCSRRRGCRWCPATIRMSIVSTCGALFPTAAYFETTYSVLLYKRANCRHQKYEVVS